MSSAAYAASWINDLPTGTIDQQELDKFLLGWGNSVAALGRAAVPEPSALLLALATICTACSLHLRKSA